MLAIGCVLHATYTSTAIQSSSITSSSLQTITCLLSSSWLLLLQYLKPINQQDTNRGLTIEQEIFRITSEAFANAQTLSNRLTVVEEKVKHVTSQSFGADLALPGHGALFIPEITTYPFKQHNVFSFLNSYLLGFDTRNFNVGARYPALALEKGADVGSCWESDLPSVNLGIYLPNVIDPSTFTVEDTHWDLLTLDERSRTPRDITVWALVEHQDSFRTSQFDIREPSTFITAGWKLPQLIQPHQLFVAVAKNQFQAGRMLTLQMQVDPLVSDTKLKSQIFIVEVVNNWGSQKTRLCHVGIFGRR